MNWKGHFKNTLFALALASFSAPQAEAIEIFTGANPAGHMNDGLITQVRRGGGGPISGFDAQIAAIARSRNARLATRNVGDFEGCGVALIDPWRAR